jgi:hypothetical protein
MIAKMRKNGDLFFEASDMDKYELLEAWKVLRQASTDGTPVQRNAQRAAKDIEAVVRHYFGESSCPVQNKNGATIAASGAKRSNRTGDGSQSAIPVK